MTQRADGLWERFAEIRAASVELSRGLSAEDCAAQSMPDASPVKWHLAHTTWFFETFVLEPQIAGYQYPSPAYRVLFNSYYNSVGPQHPRPRRGMLTRPSLDEVLAYRSHVDAAMMQLHEVADALDDGVLDVVEVGLHHEQQHQELILTDVKHLLSCNPLRPAYGDLPESPRATSKPLSWHRFEGGAREIGHDGHGFAFDNETRRHRTWLEPFEMASRLATNGDYLGFLEDDGYARPEFWLSDGWTALQERGWKAPLYWERRDDTWWVHTLAGLRPLRADEPLCHVSYYEADAFASWMGARLPLESEWESAAADRPVDGNFVERGFLHPAPASGMGDGPSQLFGDVWEWTSSAYAPYPGYRPSAGALGEYNGKFMCNQLVLRGGSCASPRSHLRSSYRNFFPPDARWQFSGVRLARDAG